MKKQRPSTVDAEGISVSVPIKKTTSPLLINESPLQVLPSLAVAIGLNEAIIVQQVHYWLNNKNKREKPYERDKRAWTYNTYKEWQEQFPFWSIPTIKRAILSAEKKGVLISEQFDIGTGDAKKYYTVEYAILDRILTHGITYPSDQIDPMPLDTHEIKMIRPSDQNDPTMGSNCTHLLSLISETTLRLPTETSLSNRAESARSTEGSGTSLQIVKQLDPLDTDFGLPEMESPIVRACGIAAKPPYTPQAPDAQATLRTPHAQAALVNPELDEIKPATDSEGIRTSAEAIEPPSTPLKSKKPATSRKPKTEKSAEESQISAGVVELMNHIGEKMGKIPNPAGQGKACKEMLKAGYPIERIKQELEIQLGELLKGRRRVVTWMTVQQTITSSVYAEQHKSTGGNNGKLATTDNDDLYAYCEQRSRLRENGEAHY